MDKKYYRRKIWLYIDHIKTEMFRLNPDWVRVSALANDINDLTLAILKIEEE